MKLLAAVVVAATTGSSVPDKLVAPYWLEMRGRPSETDLDCAGYDHLSQWAISLRDGEPVLALETPSEREDPLPFVVPKGEDRLGDRHVLQLPGGWLVGFDAGEFGGGLWFTDGREWRRVRPAVGAPANPEDPFRAENVQGFASIGSQALVLMGLDHLTGRSGRVFKVVWGPKGWSLGAAAVLDSCPEAWQIVADHLEVLTDAGLWTVGPDAHAELAVPVDFRMACPRSLAVGPDGRRYIGMRRYVLVLLPNDAGWRQRWYAPRSCPHSQRDKRWQCSCVK